VAEEEFERVVERESEVSVRRDLMEVIDAEFERIVNVYREINRLCSVVDVVKVHPHVEVHDLKRVVDGLPAVKSVYFIFDGGRVVGVDHWRYEVVFAGGGHDHVIGVIEVFMFLDGCFITKHVDEYELDGAVRDIVSDLLKVLFEEES
jgi:hypothetical protein